jgi:hypothetical protein
MSIILWSFFLFFTIILSSLTNITTLASFSSLHADELNALKEIATTLGIKRLNLRDEDPCSSKTLKIIQEVDFVPNLDINNTIGCDCSFNNNTICRITELALKTMSLRGKLPPELTKLPYLKSM